MLLFEPQPTPYDVNFRVLGVPVRIHPFFWLFALIFGWDSTPTDNRLLYLLIFTACVLLSLLVHEMGHVAMMSAFGIRSHVILYAMGGLAVPYDEPRHRWQRIMVSAGGP